jgi:hypothetical protein
MRGALDENHLAAKAKNGLRHFHADGSASENEQSARDSFHPGHFTVRPDSLEATQTLHGRDDRVGTRRNDDVLRRVTNALYLDHSSACKPPTTAKEVNATLGEPTLLAGIRVVGNHEVAPSESRFEIDLCVRRRIVRRVHGLSRAQQGLGWDACPV